MDSKAAGATTWVLDDTEMKELRGWAIAQPRFFALQRRNPSRQWT